MGNAMSSMLLTIAGASASFVAILGGFIVSRLITINGERDVTESNLQEIRYQKFLKTGERELLRRSMDEEDAICYLYDHLDALICGMDLEEVYEEDELQIIDFETLAPYWEKAKIYINRFEECLENEDCQFNSDMIPSVLAEEVADDPFAYEFLLLYSSSGFLANIDNYQDRTRGAWYEKTREQLYQVNTQIAVVEIQEQRYELDLERLKKPIGMKAGLFIFAIFSIFNIIVPLMLSVARLSDDLSTIVIYSSIGTLALGLGATFLFLVKMLKWNK